MPDIVQFMLLDRPRYFRDAALKWPTTAVMPGLDGGLELAGRSSCLMRAPVVD